MQEANLRKPSGGLCLGIDHLWLFGPLAAFTIVLSILPVVPNDLWWHLKIGELIHTSGSIPQTNIFAWSLPVDAPFTYGAWLGEYLLYSLYRLGQLELVIFARTVLLLLAFALVGYEAKRRSGSWRLAGLVITLAAAMSANNLIIRPQIWAFLPFMAFLILLGAYTDRQVRPGWLALLPLIMVFWVNVHGTYILGIILFGVYITGESLRTWLKHAGALNWSELKLLGAVAVFSVAAVIVNPQTVHIFGYVKKLMTDAPIQKLVIEWQSPAPDNYATIAFFVSILILMTVLAYSSFKLRPTDLFLVLGFTWLAWSGMRYVIWYAMAVMPILALALKGLVGERRWLAQPPRNLLNSLLVLVLYIPFVALQPWFIERLPLPEIYREKVLVGTSEGPLLSIHTPVEAAAYLKQHTGGNLFNEMGYGSYLIWAVPEQGVFVDPRVELYPYEQWLDYVRITNGVRYNELLEKYGADRMILDMEYQEELLAILPDDPSWELEYQDSYTQIWGKVK
jgi:hypothetical protein